MATTMYALVQECEHSGDLEPVVGAIRKCGGGIVSANAYLEGWYEAGEIEFTIYGTKEEFIEKAKELVIDLTFDGETVTLCDLASFSDHSRAGGA